MHTFSQWAEENKLELPTVNEVDGIAHWAYPPAYKSGQYTPGYFVPRAADAIQKLGNGAKNPNKVKYKLPPE